MSTRLSAGRIRSTYEFIKANRGTFRVEAMCRLLGVARSDFYAWVKKPVSNRAQEDARLLRVIRASFTASQGVYGAPRIFLDLREAGEAPAAPVHCDPPKQGVGHGYHLHSDLAGLALPGRRHGSVLAQDRRLGGEAVPSP